MNDLNRSLVIENLVILYYIHSLWWFIIYITKYKILSSENPFKDNFQTKFYGKNFKTEHTGQSISSEKEPISLFDKIVNKKALYNRPGKVTKISLGCST